MIERYLKVSVHVYVIITKSALLNPPHLMISQLDIYRVFTV